MKNFLSIGANIILLVVIGGAVAFFVLPRYGIMTPIEIKVVRSGSMEPAIMTGGVVLIQKSSHYGVGDVITFGADTKTSIPTTHRITATRVENSQMFYSTKGDNNEDPDPNETPANKVIGKVIFTMPYAGFVLAFAQEPIGFIVLIVIPALLLIAYEAINVWQEVRSIRRKKRSDSGGGGENNTPSGPNVLNLKFVENPDGSLVVRRVYDMPAPVVHVPRMQRTGSAVIAIMVMIAVPALVHESATRAHFFDSERSQGNTLAAGPLDIDVTLDKPTATVGTETFTFTVIPLLQSMPLVYEVSLLTSGNETFCDALTISPVPIGASNNFNPWNVDISYNGGATEGDQCQVDFTFDAYQTGGAAGTEYHDVEMRSIMLTASEPPIVENFSLQSFSVESAVVEEPVNDTPTGETPTEEPVTDEPTAEVTETNQGSATPPADPPADPPVDPTSPDGSDGASETPAPPEEEPVTESEPEPEPEPEPKPTPEPVTPAGGETPPSSPQEPAVEHPVE